MALEKRQDPAFQEQIFEFVANHFSLAAYEIVDLFQGKDHGRWACGPERPDPAKIPFLGEDLAFDLARKSFAEGNRAKSDPLSITVPLDQSSLPWNATLDFDVGPSLSF